MILFFFYTPSKVGLFLEPTLPDRWSGFTIWRHGQFKMAARSVEFCPSLERNFSGIGCSLEAKTMVINST